MSKRILHLATFNYLLKRKYREFTCPDPLALVNVQELESLDKKGAIRFLQQVLHEYRRYNPIDDISIRTACSCEEASVRRPYRLYLNPEAFLENSEEAYAVCEEFVAQNPEMNAKDAWLMFAMCNPEVFAGNVCSDLQWPEKVIMEICQGQYAPLGTGEITQPESYVFNVESEKIGYKKGSNSPVLGQYNAREQHMKQIRTLMKLAAIQPCTLEFIYGLIKKFGATAPLVFDVKVLKETKWKFCDTNLVYDTENVQEFLHKLTLITRAASPQLSKISGKIILTITPKGTTVQINGRKLGIRDLFDIDIFSPERNIIHPEIRNSSSR